MNTAKRFKLLVSFLLTVSFTCGIIAQNPPAPDYSWRLDSIVYALAPYASENDGSRVSPIVNITYTYDNNAITQLGTLRMQYQDSVQTIPTRKKIYTLNVDSGKYLEDTYATATSEFPVQRLLCMADSVKSVYDNEGRLIRTIRNYDYIILRMNGISGNMSDTEWIPSSRQIRWENEDLAIECDYTYDPSSRSWKTGQDSIRSTYINHILVMKEHITDRTFHPNGSLASFQTNVHSYNELGVETFMVIRHESRNTNNMPVSISDTRYVPGDSVKQVEETVYTYDDANLLLSVSREERTVDLASGLTLRQADYVYENDEWRLKEEKEWILQPLRTGSHKVLLSREDSYPDNGQEKHHYIRYDGDYNMVLDIDSSIDYRGMWFYRRIEYTNGEESYSRMDYDDPAFGGKMTKSEKIYSDEYKQVMSVNQQGWSGDNGASWRYDTLRTTLRYYANGFDEDIEREKYDTDKQIWTFYDSFRTRTVFDAEGNPVSATTYLKQSVAESSGWRELYRYTFIYDSTFDLYLRKMTASRIITSDGVTMGESDVTRQSVGNYYSKNSKYIGIGMEIGIEKKYVIKTEQNEDGRSGHLYIYTYVDSSDTWKISYRIDATYFPEPGCQEVASRYTFGTDNPLIHVDGDKYENLELFSDTFDIFDSYGTYIEQHAYYWEGETLLCDTIIRNQPIYDEQGRLIERIEWKQDETGNHPQTVYHYFFRPDGTRYNCAAFAHYTNGVRNRTWNMEDIAGDIRCDEQGRVEEQVYYAVADPFADEPSLIPAKRTVNIYEGDQAHWYKQEQYKWVDNQWIAAAPVYRGIAACPRLTFDEQHNITDYARGEEAYHLTYGTALSDEPVLSPAAFGIADEDMFLYTNWLNPNEIKARLLTAHHQSEDRTAVLSSTTHYMARFYYTPLRENNNPVETETEQGTTVDPNENSVTFTWPSVSGGAAYTLIIWANEEQTEKICTLYLAADGTLISIDFSRAPRRRMATDYQPILLNATIENLLPQTRYWYTIEAYDDARLLIDTAQGTFMTLGTTDISPTEKDNAAQPLKVLQNGQLIIIHPQGTYNAQGLQIQ